MKGALKGVVENYFDDVPRTYKWRCKRCYAIESDSSLIQCRIMHLTIEFNVGLMTSYDNSATIVAQQQIMISDKVIEECNPEKNKKFPGINFHVDTYSLE